MADLLLTRLLAGLVLWRDVLLVGDLGRSCGRDFFGVDGRSHGGSVCWSGSWQRRDGRGKSEARFTRSHQTQRHRTQQNIVDGERFEKMKMKMEDGAEKQSWGQAASPRGDGVLNDDFPGKEPATDGRWGLMASGEGPMQCDCIDSTPQNPGNRTRTRDEAGKRRQSLVVRRLGGQRASEGAILGALPR